MKRTVDIFVIDQTSSGKALKCSMKHDGSDAFFLPKSQLKPFGTVRKDHFCKFDVPEWLCVQHWQICGREEFEAEKSRRAEYEKTRA